MRWFIDKDTCTNILKDEFLLGLLFWRFLLIPQIRPKNAPPPPKKRGFYSSVPHLVELHLSERSWWQQYFIPF